MKKVILMAVFCLVAGFAMISCTNQYPQQNLVPQQVTVTSPQFFYLVTSMVEKGNTVWGRAKIFLGDGNRWREIIAKNKFMQQPGRVWQDKATGTWYALIYPGEKLIIDSQEVNPVFVDIIDAPTVQTQQPVVTNYSSSYYIPWGPIGIILLALVLLGIIIYLLLRQRTPLNYTAVVIRPGEGIESATRRAVIAGERAFRDKTLDIIKKGSDEDKLSEFKIEEDPDYFNTEVKYKTTPAS